MSSSVPVPGRAPRPCSWRPSPRGRGSRRRGRRPARGSRGCWPGRTPNLAVTPASSNHLSLRRSYCTTRRPRTHCPRSLSGVTIMTCSTRGSASATAAAAAERVVGLVLDHRPGRDAHGHQRVLERLELGEELRRHARAGLVAGPEVVAEALDDVVGGDAEVGGALVERGEDRAEHATRGAVRAGIGPARSAGGTARRCRRRDGPSRRQRRSGLGPARGCLEPARAPGLRSRAGGWGTGPSESASPVAVVVGVRSGPAVLMA